MGTLVNLPLAEARDAACAIRKDMKAGVVIVTERDKDAHIFPAIRYRQMGFP